MEKTQATLNAEFALALGAFLEGFGEEPNPEEYGVSEEKAEDYLEILKAS